jgi:hydroxymethylbilane synthase
MRPSPTGRHESSAITFEESSVNRLVIGTRGSQLALWQANHVADQLRRAHPRLEVALEIINTKGDTILEKPLPEIGGKGLFTAELEAALMAHSVDIAVHSLKDLPTEMHAPFTLGAILERADPRDALVSKHFTLESLPANARVGTSSPRRASQLRMVRSDLRIESIRGNVPTRVGKLEQGFDAVVLAMAGLTRLGLEAHVAQVLEPPMMICAPAQGAIAVQCLQSRADVIKVLQPLEHDMTRFAVDAERAFLSGMGGGCSLPIAAFAQRLGATWRLLGRVVAPDGSSHVTLETTHAQHSAAQIGESLAQEAIRQGALELLEVQA